MDPLGYSQALRGFECWKTGTKSSGSSCQSSPSGSSSAMIGSIIIILLLHHHKYQTSAHQICIRPTLDIMVFLIVFTQLTPTVPTHLSSSSLKSLPWSSQAPSPARWHCIMSSYIIIDHHHRRLNRRNLLPALSMCVAPAVRRTSIAHVGTCAVIVRQPVLHDQTCTP